MVRNGHLYLLKLKIMNMELSLKELNDLYYCVGSLRLRENKLLSNEVLDKLSEKIMDKIEILIELED